MAIYDVSAHTQLDPDILAQGAEYLDFQTRVAERLLGVTLPAMPAPYDQMARDAIVVQVNYQEATGQDARVVSASSRAGVTFRTEPKTGKPLLVDPQAVQLWDAAVEAYVASLAPATAAGATPWAVAPRAR